MTDLVETPVFSPGIYQLEESDVVQGGADGIDNLQAKQLGNRTQYLKQELEALAASMTLTAFARTLLASVDDAAARVVLDVPSTADVDAAIAALVASSPAALDTLNELAAALGNDANFATTITNALALKSSISDVQKSWSVVSAAGGTADAITAVYTPAITELTNGMTLYVRAAAANGTTTPTFTPAGTIAPMTIVKGANAALAIGDVAGAGHWLALQADLTLGKWVLLNPATGVSVAQLPKVPIRQTVLGSPVDASGLPSFLPATSATLSITSQNIAAGAPLIVAAANGFNSSGALDRIGISTANLAWTGLTANATNYLYVDVAENGTLTPGSTTVTPIYQQGGNPAVAANQATFNIAQMQMFVGNGATAPQAYRVFIGEAVTNAATVTSTVAYALMGRYVTGRFAVATNTAYSKNHNLGVEPRRIRVFGSDTAGGALAEPIMYWYSDGGHYLGVRSAGKLNLILQTGTYQAQILAAGGSIATAVEALVIVERGW